MRYITSYKLTVLFKNCMKTIPVSMSSMMKPYLIGLAFVSFELVDGIAKVSVLLSLLVKPYFTGLTLVLSKFVDAIARVSVRLLS